MDEKNEKLQPQQEALPPEVPAQQSMPEEVAASEAQPAPPETPAGEALEGKAPEEKTPEENTPEEKAPESPAPAPSRYTQAFNPIRDTPRSVTDATVAFSPVKTEPPIPGEASRSEPEAPRKASEISYFDGNTWEYLGLLALGALITIATLGIGLAWAQCLFWRYRAKHTVVCGRRLTFDGTGLQLFENYLIWGVLTILTLGIYGLWVPFKVRAWYCGHLFMTGYRRRHSAVKMPKWRSVLVFLTAVLCFALLLTGIVIVATGNAPWQKKDTGKPTPPPPSSSMTETAPPTSPPTTPPTTPETTPEPTTPPVTTPKPTEPAAKKYVVKTRGDKLNMRATPVSGKVLVGIPNRTVVTVTEWSGNWAKVTYGGYTGWCSGDYLEETN